MVFDEPDRDSTGDATQPAPSSAPATLIHYDILFVPSGLVTRRIPYGNKGPDCGLYFYSGTRKKNSEYYLENIRVIMNNIVLISVKCFSRILNY
jgi:hypothetical protein